LQTVFNGYANSQQQQHRQQDESRRESSTLSEGGGDGKPLTASTTGLSGSISAPPWDMDRSDCELCQARFTMLRRRHHCRQCGAACCQPCSAESLPLPHFGFDKPVRVCYRCHHELIKNPVDLPLQS
jgi:hypothetical protein